MATTFVLFKNDVVNEHLEIEAVLCFGGGLGPYTGSVNSA